MKKLLIIPFIFALSGCSEDKSVPELKSVFMHNDVICFSTDKKDYLTFYRIDSIQRGKQKIIVEQESVHLSYPDTCIKVKLSRGYQYHIAYNLNGKSYSDSFIIDNDGNH